MEVGQLRRDGEPDDGAQKRQTAATQLNGLRQSEPTRLSKHKLTHKHVAVRIASLAAPKVKWTCVPEFREHPTKSDMRPGTNFVTDSLPFVPIFSILFRLTDNILQNGEFFGFCVGLSRR